jgi:hypothetical protein
MHTRPWLDYVARPFSALTMSSMCEHLHAPRAHESELSALLLPYYRRRVSDWRLGESDEDNVAADDQQEAGGDDDDNEARTLEDASAAAPHHATVAGRWASRAADAQLARARIAAHASAAQARLAELRRELAAHVRAGSGTDTRHLARVVQSIDAVMHGGAAGPAGDVARHGAREVDRRDDDDDLKVRGMWRAPFVVPRAEYSAQLASEQVRAGERRERQRAEAARVDAGVAAMLRVWRAEFGAAATPDMERLGPRRYRISGRLVVVLGMCGDTVVVRSGGGGGGEELVQFVRRHWSAWSR